MKKLLIFFGVLFLGGCVVYPSQVASEDYKRCNLLTKEYELKVNDRAFRNLAESKMPAPEAGLVILVGSGAVIVVTSIVSGSAVVLGNSLHFLEKQGSCDDSFINDKVFAFTKPFIEDNGQLVSDDELRNISISQSQEKSL